VYAGVVHINPEVEGGGRPSWGLCFFPFHVNGSERVLHVFFFFLPPWGSGS
jgi:hypothetical protein